MSEIIRQILPLSTSTPPLHDNPLDLDRAHSMADEGGAWAAEFERECSVAVARSYPRWDFWWGAGTALALGLTGYAVWRVTRPRELQPT